MALHVVHLFCSFPFSSFLPFFSSQIDADDECSDIIFCDNATHTCLDGHPYNSVTKVCEGCGNGILENGEECEPHEPHCNSDCTCEEHYTKDPLNEGCRPICGDGFVTPEEECDGTMFCHSITCKCLHGHPLNPDSNLCSGCGNGVLDFDEECDGGLGCVASCVCEIFYAPTSPPSKDCRYR